MTKPKLDTLYRGGGVDRIRRIFPDDPTAAVERPLWDSYAQEAARLGGTPVMLYSLRRAKNHHPLYREPSAEGKDWEFHGPWEMSGTLQVEDSEYQGSAEGLKKSSNATLHIPRKEFEDVGAPDPKIGDVIELWTERPFAEVAKPSYWDVVKASVDSDTHVMGTSAFILWKLGLESRSEFRAERKVENTRI